jgi:predicted dithiol-disulfide oxidoreductase (DUF899 family)
MSADGATIEDRHQGLTTKRGVTVTERPAVVWRDEWIAARKQLLTKEKALTRQRDELNAERRRLPMVKLDKAYEFEGANGTVTLPDLFEGRPQLIVYHMMWRWDLDAGCPSCSFLIDSIGGLSHLHAANTTLAVVSRGQWPNLDKFRTRMGWRMPFYSSYGSDFNYDFHVTLDESVAPVEYNYRSSEEISKRGQTWLLEGEQPGTSVFLREGDGDVFHTYSSYARGGDLLLGTYNYLDLTPLGRQIHVADFLHHDSYEGTRPEGSHHRH